MRIAEKGFYYYKLTNKGKVCVKSERKREYIKDRYSLEIQSKTILLNERKLEEEDTFNITFHLEEFKIPFTTFSIRENDVYKEVVVVCLEDGLIFHVSDIYLSNNQNNNKTYFIDFDIAMLEIEYNKEIESNNEEYSLRIERYQDNPVMFLWLWDVYREHRISFKLNQFVYHLISKELDILNKYKSIVKEELSKEQFINDIPRFVDNLFNHYEVEALNRSRDRYRDLERIIKFDFYKKEIDPVDIIQTEMKNRFRKLRNKTFPLYLTEDGKVFDYYLSDVSDFEDNDGILLKDYVLENLGSGEYLSIV